MEKYHLCYMTHVLKFLKKSNSLMKTSYCSYYAIKMDPVYYTMHEIHIIFMLSKPATNNSIHVVSTTIFTA